MQCKNIRVFQTTNLTLCLSMKTFPKKDRPKMSTSEAVQIREFKLRLVKCRHRGTTSHTNVIADTVASLDPAGRSRHCCSLQGYYCGPATGPEAPPGPGPGSCAGPAADWNAGPAAAGAGTGRGTPVGRAVQASVRYPAATLQMRFRICLGCTEDKSSSRHLQAM